MVKKRFTVITVRTLTQGQAMHVGKDSKEYIDEISTVRMNLKDFEDLELHEGDRIRLATEHGSTVLKCAKGDVPQGMVFIAYGRLINPIVGPDTQATGMPDYKGIEAEVERYV
jgi:formylmethanofuran dehydrogenase subunit D